LFSTTWLDFTIGTLDATHSAMTQDTSQSKLREDRPAPIAVYSNYFEIGHNAFEFLIDFAQFQHEVSTVRMLNRVVCGPVHAKLLAQLLTEAIARFESDHGAIANLTEPELDALLISPSDFQSRAERARAQSIQTAVKKR
jgi:Protein of unknown function (DUF3467)